MLVVVVLEMVVVVVVVSVVVLHSQFRWHAFMLVERADR